MRPMKKHHHIDFKNLLDPPQVESFGDIDNSYENIKEYKDDKKNE